MINIQAISSGSKGNAYLLDDGNTKLLLECGVTFKELQKATNYETSRLKGALISHEHSDHCKGIKEVIKRGINVYTSAGTAAALNLTDNRIKIVEKKKPFKIGTFQIMAFDVEHDVSEPFGFLIMTQAGDKLLFATDTYYIRYKFPGLTHILLETNYSEDIINRNVDLGRCAHSLRKRIRQSHMSLETAIEFFKVNDLSKVEEIHLIHLSDSNSDEALFKKEIQKITGKPVFIA
ncbi:metal-dependent hydrolase [Bacillus phage Pascal]|uniref:Metal-dependent hydrolase n=1 Tax=Bacillus phage Pascal TaxID=1540092 RepID=A0A0A0RVF5_9CAUD|nr:metal-dependent hydrolase [Bacillus phage Pascal]AIW03668.1 metal-dependent hydrolase [Bacillus phage Pascal]